MKEFPHIYTTNTKGSNDIFLTLSSDKLPQLRVSPPKEFDGPEGYWSPETFFSASISSCFILTFKAIAKSKKIIWEMIDVDADAYLDKVDGKLSFTRVDIFVTLKIPASEDDKKDVYSKALHKAEETCLITNSINAQTQLHIKIESREKV